MMSVNTFYAAAQGSDKFHEMTDWCMKNLYHGGHYEPNWYAVFPFIYFKDEKEYAVFLLRWS